MADAKLERTFQCTVESRDHVTLRPYSNVNNLPRIDVVVRAGGSRGVVCLSREDALEFAACIFEIFDAPMSAAATRLVKGKDDGT